MKSITKKAKERSKAMKDKNKNKKSETLEETQEKKPETSEEKEEKIDPNLAKIEALEKELAEWKDKAYRTVADCDNLRKSYEKDHQIMVKYRGQPFVEKLLPTLDTFYLVLKNEPTDPNLKAYLAGFQMIYKSMLQALESEGVKLIMPTIGKEFDHQTMQAIEVVDGEKDNIVVEIRKPGYLLRDRLVSPASVVVSKVKVEKAETKEEKTENNDDAFADTEHQA